MVTVIGCARSAALSWFDFAMRVWLMSGMMVSAVR